MTTFWEIVRFEFGYQVRRVWPWLFLLVLFVVSTLMTRDNSLSEALYEEFFVNSPFAIAKTTVFGTFVWLLLAAAIAGEAAARDVSTRMYPLVFTTPLAKFEYLGGRFTAAFLLNVLLLLAVQMGIVAGVYATGVDPAVIGPFRPAGYVTAYAYISLPNAFVGTAIQFLLAARSGRPMAAYLGSVLLLVMGFFIASFVLFRQSLGKLLDPIGIRFIVEDLSYLWTTAEKSSRLLTMSGTLLANRLVWMAFAALALVVTYVGFRFSHRSRGGPQRLVRKTVAERALMGDDSASVVLRVSATAKSRPPAARHFGVRAQLHQAFAIAGDAFRSMAMSWAGAALLVAIPLLSIPVVIDQTISSGVPLIPATAQVIGELTGPLTSELSRWIIIPLLLVFFAGELIWRERDAGVSEITATMPGSDWVRLGGRLLSLAMLLAAFCALIILAGIIAQSILGYHAFELWLYVRTILGLQLVDYTLFAVLALTVHVLVDHKYIGHLVAIVLYMLIALAPLFGIEHSLLVYGSGPWWTYSDMSGFGDSIRPWMWFKLYWAAWALILAVAARVFWVRSKERGFAVRVRGARRQLRGAARWTAVAALLGLFAVGGFVGYNTNVLNQYRNSSDVVTLKAEYEQRYKRYEEAPQPRVTAHRLHVDMYPAKRAATIRGEYVLLNATGSAIDTIHVATAPGAAPESLSFSRTASLTLDDYDRGHRIYALSAPLLPGDSISARFVVVIKPRGFSHRGLRSEIKANGSYFTSSAFPTIGYQSSRELASAGDRRANGLIARPVIPSLYDSTEWNKRAGRVTVDAIVSTDDDQVAVGPGQLRRTWTEGQRRFFDYSADAVTGSEQGFFSARYAVFSTRWNNVAIQVFHDPRHTANLERLLRSVRASLAYYSEHFGAYRHPYLSVVERPGNGTGMHADAAMITHAEGFSRWNPSTEPGRLDLPSAIVAHEMGHQWTVPYAFVEGAPVMSESLAWYAAMQVVHTEYGEAQLRHLLSFMRQPNPYPPIRRGEPLLRGLDPYMSYRRGPFALHALTEYMGVPRVNAALRRLIESHRDGSPPLATTLDLHRELKAETPDSLQYLLHDLFEVNTFWALRASRVGARKLPTGEWQVTLRVAARKTVADSTGVEREVPLDEWLPIGVFANGVPGDELSMPLYLRYHRVRTGEQTITVTVSREPSLAGIDPHHILDWEEREDDDNIAAVKVDR